jgi:hypothetical protein
MLKFELDCLDGCFGDASTAIIDIGPSGFASTWIDFDELHARRHLHTVTHNSANDPVERRVDWLAIEMPDDEPGKDLAPDIDWRMPSARPVRIDEAFRTNTTELIRDTVGCVRRPGCYNLPDARGLGLDRDIAIYADAEKRSEPHSNACHAAKMRRNAVFLHTGIDQHVKRADCKNIRKLERRHHDTVGIGQRSGSFYCGLRPNAFDSVDHYLVTKEHVVKGHTAANDRREWVVAENYSPTDTV